MACFSSWRQPRHLMPAVRDWGNCSLDLDSLLQVLCKQQTLSKVRNTRRYFRGDTHKATGLTRCSEALCLDQTPLSVYTDHT